jgi:hypothetical protein
MSWISEGLDLGNVAETSDEEITANLMHVWSWRGATYEFAVKSLMLDHAPEFSKLHRRAADLYGRPQHEHIIALAIQNLHSYILLGWETGILNEFVTLRRHGLAKEKVMELCIFAQIYAGIRGIGLVVRSVGDTYPAFAGPEEPLARFPTGWAPDPEAFKCGLDLSTPELTGSDRTKLLGWYEQTIGRVPESVQFALDFHPEFLKASRAKWEVAIKTLPKQVVPWQMLRHHMMSGNVDGLREAVLLSKAWGISREDVIRAISSSAYYTTGVEGLYAANRGVRDLLENW